MKKSTKIWLIVGAALIVLGGIIFVCAMTATHWDYEKLGTDEFETHSYDITESFRHLDIEVHTADIFLAPSEDGQCRVVCRETKNATHRVDVQDGALKVRVSETKRWQIPIGISTVAPTVTVYLPASEYGALEVGTETGVISVPAGFTFDCMELSSNTGDVSVRASASGEIEIETDSGDVFVEDVTAGGVLTVESDTGDVTVVHCEAENFRIDSDTGDVSRID